MEMLKQLTVLDTVSVRTNMNEVFNGQVCCTFPNNEFVVLKEDIKTGFSTFKMIRSDSICEVKPHLEGEYSEINTNLPENYIEIIKRREEIVINDAISNSKFWGNNVTSMGQATFDFIHKTHPNCSWNNGNIEVMGITVSPPYLPENCSGDDKKALERIKCVIEKFRERVSE
ncbi:putative lsm12 [Cryptosporidium felis]|nr:putative lsm12 [Cryptosporidium felis]